MHAKDDTLGTAGGDNGAVSEDRDNSTRFDPDTGRRLKKAAIIFVVVLVVAFIAVRVDRFFKDRSVAEETQQAVDMLADAENALEMVGPAP